MRVERDVDGGNVRGCVSRDDRERNGRSQIGGAAADRSGAFLAGIREKLRSEILAIEHRSRGDGEDDPQACRWFDRARRVRRHDSDPPGFPPGDARSHSLQEQDLEHPPATVHEDRAEVRPARHAALRTGWHEIDTALGGWPLGTIHELFGIEWDGPVRGAGGLAPSASSFRPACRSSCTCSCACSCTWIPPLGVAIRLASSALRGIGGGVGAEGESGLPRRGVLWVGRAIRPDPGALRLGGCSRGGLPQEEDLITRSFFLDPGEDPVERPGGERSSARPRGRAGPSSGRMPIRTWAIEQAIRHEAFAAIVADARGLTVAESRRLQVAASDRNLPALILLLREAREASARSVAGFRWRVESCPCDHSGDGEARYEPVAAWRLRLLRGRASLPPEVRRAIESDEGLGSRIDDERGDRSLAGPSAGGAGRVPERRLARHPDRGPSMPVRSGHGAPGSIPSAWSTRPCVG